MDAGRLNQVVYLESDVKNANCAGKVQLRMAMGKTVDKDREK